MNVCVYGSSINDIQPIFLQQGEALGAALAEKGIGLVFGGGANGMMGAVVRGIKSKGGYAVGIAPRFFDKPGILFDACDEFIYTETMRERKQLMEDKSDAFIVTPGGLGTLEEFFEMITLRQIGQTQKPIIIMNIDGYYDPLLEMLRYVEQHNFLSQPLASLCSIATTVDEVIAQLR